MTRKDKSFLGLLAVLAIFVWARDRRWATEAADTLPVLAGIPLFIWLGSPWKFRAGTFQVSSKLVAVAVAFFLVGIPLNLTFLLALGWTTLLWAWLSSRLESNTLPAVRRLLVLPMLAFPWVTLDFGQSIGWYFRLSGAWSAAHLFALLGLTATQDGTNITVQGLPVSVEVACAGLNTLQATLIAGSMLAFIFIGNRSRYWWNLPLLVVLAWMANTLRIIVLCIAALTISPQFAEGIFHKWGGWGVIVLMFLLCWPLFAMQAVKRPAAPADQPGPA
ncbi:MAG TPA: archaeosortase/exosortase family protein [Verrucomicrobiae bacterium]|jgi:exosortase|nr:archaeosortase/exosortase family protein [Verrucomicrobiae bacterium]